MPESLTMAETQDTEILPPRANPELLGQEAAEAELLRSKGTVARYTVEKGQPHRLETLAGANAGRLFDGFEETKKGCSK